LKCPTFTHDALDRPTRIDYPDGSFEETTWTHLDPTQFRDRQGRTSTRVFNPMRELIEETDPLGRTVRYEWCRCGALQKLWDAKNNPPTP
jgi:YD repeat-containing protein